MTSPWLNFAVALGLGLLIGLERERTKGEGSTRRPAGIRTFALAALFGAIAYHLGGVSLLALATVGVTVLTALSYIRGHDQDPGLTTEVGLISAPLLGGLAMSDVPLAAGLGVIVAAVFAAKESLHRFVSVVLTESEVRDGLVFAVVTLVIWPQLPDRFLGPWQALNPSRIWMLVVLMLALGACGHVATRLLGLRFGLPITGFASGFISSTATIGSMASRAAKDPTSIKAAVAGASLSTVATFAQLALVLLAVSEPTLTLIAPALTAGGLTATLYGLAFAIGALRSNDDLPSEPGRAFSVGMTLGLTGMMAAMLVIAAGLKQWFGEAGVTASAAVAGFVDAHSASISVASLAAAGQLKPEEVVGPILFAMTSNAIAKIVMAFGTGRRGFALRVVPGIILSMVAAWGVALLAGLNWTSI
jgi:uncharacterized membrane protein (DUF4010 family)